MLNKRDESQHNRSSKPVTLTSDIISACGMSKVFKYSSGLVNGMDLDNTGKYLVTTTTEGTIRFYDCMDAKLRKTISCQKYGASRVQFTHHSKSVLVASHSGAGPNAAHSVVRYLSLYDNAYIRCFEGHSDRITSIALSFVDDSFMTASTDRHVRLWDLRQTGCVAVCKVGGRPTMALDPEGLVFAVGTGKNELKLYDRRKYQHGPFETIDSLPRCHYEWCDLRFSPDGKHILISTRTNLLLLVDSFKGALLGECRRYKNTNNDDIAGCFTPCGRFVACGSSNGDLHFWSKDRLIDDFRARREGKQRHADSAKVAQWKGHPRTVRHFLWNPKYLVAVSAAQNVSLWLPRTIGGGPAGGVGGDGALKMPNRSCLKKGGGRGFAPNVSANNNNRNSNSSGAAMNK